LVAFALLVSTCGSAKAANATADNSNSASTFGPAVVATVPHGSTYSGITTTVTAVTGSGGSDAGGSDTLLAGVNNGANGGGTASVSQAWRTRLTSEVSPPSLLVSDVLNQSGLETSGNTTDPYVLNMSFNASLVPGSLSSLVNNKLIVLASQDQNGKWILTVAQNTGNVVTNPLDNRYGYHGSYAAFQADPLGGNGGTPASEMGAWGVDVSNDQVWAVIDHESMFAVAVPEPGTIGALCAAGAALLLRRRSRA
jgi:hypothetical protein